jgi:hypothetical protein
MKCSRRNEGRNEEGRKQRKNINDEKRMNEKNRQK